MNMMWRMLEPKYMANPILAKVLDILFILHADHEQNCSTNTMRSVGSAWAAAIGELLDLPVTLRDERLTSLVQAHDQPRAIASSAVGA